MSKLHRAFITLGVTAVALIFTVAAVFYSARLADSPSVAVLPTLAVLPTTATDTVTDTEVSFEQPIDDPETMPDDAELSSTPTIIEQSVTEEATDAPTVIPTLVMADPTLAEPLVESNVTTSNEDGPDSVAIVATQVVTSTEEVTSVPTALPTEETVATEIPNVSAAEFDTSAALTVNNPLNTQSVDFNPPMQVMATSGQTVRIMPLGDSITQSNSSHDSYRRELWSLLQNAGYNVDFVGSMTSNYQGGPPNTDFDLDHEGHWGWRVDEILAQISGWMAASQPDIALVHLGTNDIFQGQDVTSTINEISQLIDAMRAHNPNIVIYLAQVIPHNRGDRPSLDPLNAAIPGLIASKNTAQSPVILVDQHRGFNAATDTFDAVHPNAAGEEKMAYRWYEALIGRLPSPTANSGKPRLLVAGDILGGDPDDEQTFIRLLSYSNEFDLVGLIASSNLNSNSQEMAVRPDGYLTIIDQYAQVRGNMLLHDSGFPTEAYLRDMVRPGQPTAGRNVNVFDSIGEGEDTLASDWIIAQVDANDPRPLYITVWGGTADLAQALWRVQNDRSPAEVAEFVSKIRLYAIDDQDTTGEWIRQNFPSLFYILNLYPVNNDSSQSVFRGMYLGGDTSNLTTSWINTHVRSGHGPMGALYPLNGAGVSGIKEGDTPSWFYFYTNGLDSPENPDWGGWGGRFELAQNNLWRDAEDTVNSVTSGRATVWRWRDAYQNDFQARMDWQVQPYSGANHNPVVSASGSLERTVLPGMSIILDASGSTDPDGNTLSYEWYVYPEAGTYTGTVTIPDDTAQTTSFLAPNVSGPETIHVILEVTDNGSPALTSYQRIVVNVDPDAQVSPSGEPPVAANDGPYSIQRAGSITVDAPGVLENDSDPEEDGLFIDDYTQPTNGTVTLNADGSFTYTHAGGTSNSDSFTYTITDGNLNYATATVSIAVMPDLVFTPALLNINVEQGATTTTSIAITSTHSSIPTIGLATGGETWLTVPANVTGGDTNSLTVDASALTVGTYNATITASADGHNDDVLPIQINVLEAAPEGADVSVVKSAPAQRNYNNTLAYNLRVRNDGPGEATNITVVDTLPADVTFVSASRAELGCAQNNGVVTCAIESMAAGTFVDIRIETEIDLQEQTYDITATNNAPFAVDSLSLAHDFPEDLVFVSVAPSDVCSEDAGTISCDFGTTDAEETQTATVVYFSDEGRVLSNIANITAESYDPDTGNNISSASTTITAENLTNTPPTITPIGEQSGFNGDVVSLVIDAQDAEIDALTYGASGLPDGLTIDSSTGEISGILTPEAVTNSPYSVTISVDDGENAPVTTTFNWVINERIAVTGLTLVDAATDTIIGPLQDGDVINLFVVGDELSVIASTDPETVGSVRFALDAEGNFFTDNTGPYTLQGDTGGDYAAWTPAVGEYTLEAIPYSQADGGGYSGISLPISFEIIDQANFAPEIEPIDDQNLIEGDQVVLDVTSTDVEEEAITLTASVTDNGDSSELVDYTFVDNGDGTGTLTLVPQVGSAGEYTATITAADEMGSSDMTFAVIVLTPNELPIADAGPDQTVDDLDEDGTESITLDGSGSSDSDGTLVSYEWTENGSVIATEAQATLDFAVGLHDITLTVTDDRGDSASDMVMIFVSPPNQAPIAEAGPNQSVVDNNRDGEETISLDGSGSSDSDGTIASYTWSLEGSEIATGPQPDVTLPVGIHFITLTVTDDGGKTANDTVTIVIEAAPPVTRITDGLLALYEFNDGSGNTVNDTSGTGTPLNLTINNINGATWGSGNLSITGENAIQSSQSASKITDAARSTNEITIEAWITPANITQEGPARIVTISGDPSNRNVTLGQGLWGGQPKTVFDGRIRTTSSTTYNGVPSVSTPANMATTNLTHVVYTRASNGTVTIYVNGVAVVTQSRGGSLGNWNSNYPLLLGNEMGGGRGWQGTYHLIAFYDQALSSSDVTTNYGSGPEGTDGAGSNEAPTANAGADQIVTDSDNDGTEDITLDGSGSTDSDGTITDYAWYENGILLANGAQPTVSLNVGTHIITLVVTDDAGAQTLDAVTVIVNQPPNADAGADQTIVDVGAVGSVDVTLDGTGSSDTDGTVASYAWSEGSTQLATGAQPTVSLPLGEHTITLTVTDDHGATATDTVVISVVPDNALPTADAGPDQTVKDTDESDAETVTLNGSGTDSDGTIESYIWSEDGTQVATDAQPTIELAVGSHTLTLTVVDNDGGEATDEVVIVVQPGNLPPVADAGPDQTIDDADGNGDENVVLDGTASNDDEDTIIAWEWSLEGHSIASGAQPTVTLPIGTHLITLTITTDGGSVTQATDTVSITVVETNAAPLADAGPDQTVPDNDDNGSAQVTLDASGSSDDNGIVSYVWRENTTEIATGEQATVDLSVGVHNIQLIVTDAQGRQDADSLLVTVVANGAPIAEAGPDQLIADADQNGTEAVTLNASASTDDSEIVSYVWTENSAQIAMGVQPTINLSAGIHLITLTVTDDLGAESTDTVTVEVNAPPVANAGPDQTVTDSDGNGSELITLNGSSSTDSDNTISSYIWTENSVQIATGTEPQVSLAVGTHVITLTVSSDGGANPQASDTVTITVLPPNQPPVAEAGTNQTLEDSNLNGTESVVLNGAGSSDLDGTITGYEWVRNGEVIGLGAQPTVVLPVGLHSITLTVTDDDGLTASDTVTIEIFSVPVANAGPDQTLEDTDNTGSEGVMLNGAGSTLAYGTITGYSWSLNGSVIASGPQSTVELPVGTHTITLTITADRGLTTTATDTVIVTVQQPNLRVMDGLLALYEFNEGGGTSVADSSGNGAPLNLSIGNAGNVTWGSGSLTVNSSTVISSGSPATKIISAAQATNTLTFEVWVTAANTTQTGPARLMTISQDRDNRNVTLGQGATASATTAYNGRIRSTSTTNNGVPNVDTPSGLATTTLKHVVMTSANGVTTLYVDGVQVASGSIGGNFSNWNSNYPLALANEPSLERPWLGTYHLAAVYGRALSAQEVQQNYQAGPQ